MAYIFLIISSAFSIAASVSLKMAALSNKSSELLNNKFTDQLLCYLCAVVFYGLGFVFYALSLKKLDLSLAYPLMVGVSIFGIFIYGLALGNELMTFSRLTGGVLLIIGIFLINR